ncbi:MAG: cytochrome, partial [Ilumatobacteraceae bacterium]|nr:cytochrome [Ilumatobacteraceae bacterium]
RRVDEMLAEADAETGTVDFKRIAYLLPLRVLGDLLGIPLPDLPQVQQWAQTIAANKFNVDSGDRVHAAVDAYSGLHAYIERLIEAERRGDSNTGLVAAIVEAEDTDHVTHDEAVGMLALMLFAGHETTTNLLAIGTLELLRHHDQWEVLCSDPTGAASAVEELLRFVTPVHYLQYVATATRTIRGARIQEGDTMIGVVAAANRDPAVFEDPDRLNLGRPNSKDHLSLGFGPHFCIGAGLARMEATIAFGALSTRYPDMSLDADEITWGGSGSFRTPVRVPIRLQ